MEPKIPDRFEIREEIYRSEQNVRLRAFDTKLEQEVVLEYSGEGARQIPSASERSNALRQARMRARVRHEHIQPLKEIIEQPEAVVHVLEPRSGVLLKDLLEQHGTLEPEDLVDLGIHLADALQALHAEGVVHRAISADNILMDAPDKLSALTGFAFAKPITGFGQSSLQYNSAKHTAPAARALPNHPAPEQIAGQAADARSDVFALGCVLYRCLTARPAFDDHGTWKEPVDPYQVSTSIPKPLAAVVMKCLRHSPMSRYPTMLELGTALRGVRDQMERAAARTGTPRIWQGAAAAAGVCLAIWAGVGLFADGESGGDPERQPLHAGRQTSAPDERLEPSYSASHAVLIACNYKSDDPERGIQDLNHPVNDVTELGRLLEQLGFDVTQLINENATESSIRETLRGLQAKLQRNDQVFIYVAGHGDVHTNTSGRNSSAYILPHDAKPRAEGFGSGENWISVQFFARQVQEYSAKHVLLAFDCCRSGSVFQQVRGRQPRNSKIDSRRLYSEQYLRSEAKVIMASCAGYQNSPDDSFFARGFREKLQEVIDGEPVNHTAIFVHIKDLGTRTRHAQFPDARNLFETHSDFVFLPKKTK